ncbi:MAG: hypothetical protein K2K77_07180, partial [Duncaniella sp.]|nr:hypothetical protein [Duncaniella sp.]
MSIEQGGTPYEFTASLGGQTWAAGNTYTYHLSANPSVDRFILTVESPLKFNYTGGTKTYTVTSRHEKTDNGALVSEEIPWTAEFVDADGNVIERAQSNVGFRSVEVKNGQVLVNGKPIRFRGVNRHEHDPQSARVMTDELMIKDIKLMKQANINAV